jgi:hypothetical protein
MILKERDPREHPDTDKFSKAGAAAEQQMAFYLRRAFVDTPDIFIFNDLRLKDDANDRVQVDHLVLHRHGFVVIESKSVSTGVAVNNRGEWVRFWNGRPEGMPSPVQQVKLQIDFLRRAFDANCETLIGKLLGIKQMRFVNCPFEILVAVSDHGTIKRETDIPEVVKADQVPDRICAILERHKKARSFFSLTNLDTSNMDGVYNFSDEEIGNISRFCLEHHYPLVLDRGSKTDPAKLVTVVEEALPKHPASPPSQMKGLGICDKCGAQCLIQWGKYGYYWKCLKCNGNMPLREYCPTCKQKIKLRKDGNRFFKYCGLCKTGETLYCEFEMA